MDGTSSFINDSTRMPALARVESLRACESGPGQNPPTPCWPGLPFADIEPTHRPSTAACALGNSSGLFRQSTRYLSDSAWTSRSNASISEEAERDDKRMPPGGLLPGGQSSDRKPVHAGVRSESVGQGDVYSG